MIIFSCPFLNGLVKAEVGQHDVPVEFSKILVYEIFEYPDVLIVQQDCVFGPSFQFLVEPMHDLLLIDAESVNEEKH